MEEKWFLEAIDLQLFADSEKTEEATPHRKQEARKKGQVAKSTDLNAALGLLVVMLMVFALKDYFLKYILGFLDLTLGHWLSQPLSQENLGHLGTEMTATYFNLMAPLFIAAVSIGILSNAGQVGLKISTESIKPKLSHLNPIQGFKRMFSRRSLVELAKSLFKIILVGFISFKIIVGALENLLFLVDMQVFQSVQLVAGVIFKIGMAVISAFLVIAILDYIFQRYEYKRNIRMSKQEVKEEYKQLEGDPLLRARLREKQRQLALHRMMHSIPEATVIVTNPTHLAVALQYQSGLKDRAPILLAKGAGTIAARIKEKAAEHQIPIMEDKPVARFLYQHVDIGQEIPPELYQAVAEILAILYRMGKNI
ncbi:MAG: flagellar biosynthesis protein FlhB [Bacillota bacterium]